MTIEKPCIPVQIQSTCEEPEPDFTSHQDVFALMRLYKHVMEKLNPHRRTK